MTLEELKESNPNLYAQCMAVGIAEGIEKERLRCVNHLPKNPKHPLAKLACTFIKSGKAFDNPLVTASYLCLKMKARQHEQQQARDSENVVSMLEYKAGVKRDENDNH